MLSKEQLDLIREEYSGDERVLALLEAYTLEVEEDELATLELSANSYA